MYGEDTMINKQIPCEVYSRVTGYIRPLSAWNPGKQQEFKDRKLVFLQNEASKAPKSESFI